MTRSVTYVDVEAPTWVVQSPPATEFYTFRQQDVAPDFNDPTIFATTIPSIKSVEITPAIVSLGQDLGQRATVTVTFKDHRHIFNGEAFDSGTFWGKWRGRYGLKLFGMRLNLVRTAVETPGLVEQRRFVIESTDGPSTNGEYKIIAKDMLKLADGDRAQAPVLSNGFLASDITDVATSMTLLPTGIGDEEYPAMNSPDNGFYVAVGGTEIIQVYRNSDTLHVIARGRFNTAAAAHTAQDRVQLVLTYTAAGPDEIIYDLLTNYASIDASFISAANWSNEVLTYLNTVYTAAIAEPTDVNKLVSELIEQAGLVVWWDDIGAQIRLQVLRPIATSADTFDEDNMMAGSLEVREQPQKRLSQVYTYFAKINPLVKEDQINNYRSTAFAIDEDAETEYGSAAIKKVFSRWIPDGGRSVADTLNDILLARFVTPPRLISFDLLRGSTTTPALGIGYQVSGWPFQDETGAGETVSVQITRLNPKADVFEIEAEELTLTEISPTSPDAHSIIIDATIYDVNLRTMHDSIFTVAVSGTTVTCTILAGIIVGSTSTATPAFNVGTWPAGVTINLIVTGRIQGRGGDGGTGGFALAASSAGGAAGGVGGTALYSRQAITLSGTGEIWGGGGGAGGDGGFHTGTDGYGGYGGGGGAGSNVGVGGAGGFGSTATGVNGLAGTTEAGGTSSADGGGPGLAGATGGNTGTASGGAGGAAGAAIDGAGTVSGTVSDVQGSVT